MGTQKNWHLQKMPIAKIKKKRLQAQLSYLQSYLCQDNGVISKMGQMGLFSIWFRVNQILEIFFVKQIETTKKIKTTKKSKQLQKKVI